MLSRTLNVILVALAVLMASICIWGGISVMRASGVFGHHVSQALATGESPVMLALMGISLVVSVAGLSGHLIWLLIVSERKR